jgi:hypothetical protein
MNIRQLNVRRIAIIAGVFFWMTEITAVVGLLLYQEAMHDVNFILGGSAGDNRVLLGAFFEALLALANIGTAVTLFPIVRRQSEGLALGYVAGRVVESMIIIVGIISMVTLVRMRQDVAGAAGASAISLVVAGKTLMAIHDWTFLFGPDLVLGVNSLVLAYLMYRSALVPRAIATLGLVGGPLVSFAAVLVLFGVFKQYSSIPTMLAAPVFLWEVSLATWMIAKGFKPSALVSLDSRDVNLESPTLVAPAA